MARWTLVWLAVSVASAGNTGLWPEHTSEFQLSNGLKVVVFERPTSAAVSLTLLAKAGWSDDPAGHRGLSRVMARMVEEGGYAFGSKNLAEERKAMARAEELADKWEAELNKPQPDNLEAARLRVDAEQAAGTAAQQSERSFFRRQIERAGGSITRAEADATYTAFSAELPANQVEVWFTGIAAWLKDPSWRGFYAHRAAVAESARQMNEQTAVYTALTAKAYPEHAWSQPDAILAELQKLRIRDLAAYHKAAFRPANLVLAIAGNLSAASARALAEKHLAELAQQPAMEHDWARPGMAPFQISAARPGVQVMAAGYRRPNIDSPDDPVIDVISHLLVAGPDSVLQKQLVLPLKAVNATGAGSFPATGGGGMLTLAIVPLPGRSLEDTERDLQAAIDTLAAKPLPPEDLLPAKRRFIAGAVRLLEEDRSAAELLARAAASYGSAKSLPGVLDKLEAITPADVQRVAAKYLQDSQRVSFTWTGGQR